MKKKIGDVTDYIKANRKASREEEIAAHGKQISMRTAVHKSKKIYDRNREKRAGIKNLPFLFMALSYQIPFVSLYPYRNTCILQGARRI